MSRKSTKFTVFICNLIISVLCIISIGAYFVLPFWKVDFSLHISADTLTNLLQSTQSESESENEEESKIPEIDYSEIVGADGADLTLSITLQTADVLSALNGDAEEVVRTILNDNIDKIVDQLNGPLNEITENAIKMVAKTTIADLLNEKIKDIYPDGTTDEEIEDLMHEAGLTDTYITEKTNEFFDLLYADNATVDNLADKAVEILEDAFSKMETADPDTNFHLSENDKQSAHDSVSNALEMLAAEDGTIDMESLIADLLLQALGQGESSNEEASAKNSALATALSSESENPDSNTENAVEELKTALRAKITSIINEDTAKTIAQVLKIVSYVLLFTFFTWGWLIIKIILKLGAKNNAIKLKLPIWLGSIPFWVLYLLPTIAITLLKNPPASMANMFGGGIAEAMASFNVSFFTCAWVSFIVGVVLCLFSIFFYSRQRKILKKYKKGILKDEAPAFNSVGVELEEDKLDE